MYKSKLLFQLIFIFSISQLYAGKHFDYYYVNPLFLGWNINVSENNNTINNINFNLLDIGMESSKSGIGLGIAPIKYNYNFDEHMVTIVAINSYWNVLNPLGEYLSAHMLGPYISLEYPIWYPFDRVTGNDYLLNIGARYSIRVGDNNLIVSLISVESGYRKYNGNDDFYFGIQVSGLLVIGLFQAIFDR